LWSGEVLMFAGPSGVSELNLVSGQWSAVAPNPFPASRYHVAGSTLYATSTDDGSGNRPAPGQLARYDAPTRAWSLLPPLPLEDVFSVVELGDELFVLGRLAIPEVWKPALLQLDATGWVDTEMPEVQAMQCCFAYSDRVSVYAWGSHPSAFEGEGPVGLKYAPAANEWTETAVLPGSSWECYDEVAHVGPMLLVDRCGRLATYDRDTGVLVDLGKLAGTERISEPMVVLDGAIYRWGSPYCYADCLEPPPGPYFHRLWPSD
jgi:hypothetical protein